MGDTYINAKEVKEILLEKLNKAIEENSEITSKHNDRMLKYTRWICGLTIGIGIIAFLQLILIIPQVIILFRR